MTARLDVCVREAAEWGEMGTRKSAERERDRSRDSKKNLEQMKCMPVNWVTQKRGAGPSTERALLSVHSLMHAIFSILIVYCFFHLKTSKVHSH